MSNIITVSTSTNIGRRQHMEDVHGVIPDLTPSCSLFWVADGHGGCHVASFVSKALPDVVKKMCVHTLRSEGKCKRRMVALEMQRVCSTINSMLCDQTTIDTITSGSTLCIVLMFPKKFVMTNCGDSRAVWGKDGKLVGQSTDHNASSPVEVARIISRGGYIWNDRLYGELAVFRAFGDFRYLPQISSEPDTYVVRRSLVDSIVLASDGVYETNNISSERVLQMIQRMRGNPRVKHSAYASVLESVVSKCGHTDNRTIIVINC